MPRDPRRRDVMATVALLSLQRDQYGRGHAVRLARYAAGFTRRLGLPAADVRGARRGGFLHDVGKAGIPDAVLNKTGPLRPG